MMTESLSEVGDGGRREEGRRDARRLVPVGSHGERSKGDGKHTAVVPVGLGREWVGWHVDRPFFVVPYGRDPGHERGQAGLDSLGDGVGRVERVQVGQGRGGKVDDRECPVVGIEVEGDDEFGQRVRVGKRRRVLADDLSFGLPRCSFDQFGIEE